METRNSCKTESSLLIKKPMYSFNWQEERLHDAAPAPEMGTVLLWACAHAFPGMAGWCQPGCKQQLGVLVPGQVPGPTLLRPQGRRGQPGHDVTAVPGRQRWKGASARPGWQSTVLRHSCGLESWLGAKELPKSSWTPRMHPHLTNLVWL